MMALQERNTTTMTEPNANQPPYSPGPEGTPPVDPTVPPPGASPSTPSPAPGDPLPYASSAAGLEPSQDARTWGMLCHVASLAGYVIPLGNIVGPLVVWLVKKDQYPFVDDQGKESLNFQITMTIAAFVSALLICVGIGIVLLIVVGIVDLVFAIIATIKAYNGERYRYPFNWRLV